MKELAIIALTPHGLELGQRLAQALGYGEVLLARESARSLLEDSFRRGRPLVCIMALGIVVRILGPLARDKETDPPVVVVDEAGHFAISVLGGHAAGANELTWQVARALAATPVITTASEALGLPAVDLIGRARGWRIEDPQHLKAVAAAMVSGQRIGVHQQAGSSDWWQEFGPWPANFHWLTSWPPSETWAGLLVISDRLLAVPSDCPTIVYRPPTLVLGIGCRRGVPFGEIEEMFQRVCDEQQVTPLSLGIVATVTLKADEPGLIEFADRHGVPLRTYFLEELAAVGPLPTPSERVRSRIGIAGVCEPAAMLAADTTELLMPKYRGERVTMALARRDDA